MRPVRWSCACVLALIAATPRGALAQDADGAPRRGAPFGVVGAELQDMQPPPPMQPMQPPPPMGSPPGPGPAPEGQQPGEQAQGQKLDEAEQKDSGRNFELVWLD